MGTNREMLDRLFKEGKIDIAKGALFDKEPEPFPGGVDFDCIDGMMLALAIGDSLGATTEGKLPKVRRDRYGEIGDYLKNRHASDSRGYPTDDTQLSFWTLEQLNIDKGFVPENVAECLYQNTIYGIGGSVKEFIANHKEKKLPWYEAGPKSAGNGALMRIAPMLIPHLKFPGTELWVDTALSAMITHNDSASITSCLSFLSILWELLHMDSPPDPSWWVDTFVSTSRDLEIDSAYESNTGGFCGTIWEFVEDRLPKAYAKGLSTLEASESWHSGAYLMETVPCVLYILMKHGDDLEEAMVRAVNDTKDNDTIAAIVGAALGALHGKKSIPQRWLNDLSGCTRIEKKQVQDEGRIFEILEKSRCIWG